MRSIVRVNRRGFSLIEIMISAALFFVGLTAVFTCYTTGANLVAHTRHITRATAVAEGTLEELIQRFPGDDVLDTGTHPATPRHYDGEGVLKASGGVYQVGWRVAPYPKLAGMREVTVRVEWTEQGVQKSLELTTWRT